MAYKQRIDVLKEVEQELKRFQKKLKEAIEEQRDGDGYPTRKYAASKRAALDLKIELTKLTQDFKYRHQ